MITETQFSAVSTKETPRKEKVKENDPRFQDIFTALTAALQIANPQVANSLSNAPNNKRDVGNVVAPQKSGKNQKDISRNRVGQNTSQKSDRSFSDSLQNAQENPITNKTVSKKDDLKDTQTSRSDSASLKPVSRKNVEDRKPQPESNDNSKDATAQSQDDSLVGQENKKIDDSVKEESESDLNKLAKALQSLPSDTPDAQSASPDTATPQQFLSILNDQGSKIEDLLVQAGMSEADAKNLLNKVETQVENSVRVSEALKGEMNSNEVKLPAQTEAIATANNTDSGKETTDKLSKILQNQNNGATASDKTDIDAGLPKTEGELSSVSAQPVTEKGKTSMADNQSATDKGKNDSFQTFSQALNITSLHVSNPQDKDANAQDFLNVAKDISDLKAGGTETIRAATNTPAQNLSADLSPKALNEIKQMLAPQEVINRGTVEKPVVNQIIEKFSLQGAAGQQNEINIKLDPPNLGTVRINIVSDGDNVNTTLITDNHAVKQTIESNLTQLRDAMADQGLKVQSFTVLVGGNQGQRGQNHQQQQGTANFPGTPFQESSNRQANEEPVFAGRKKYSDKSQSISVFA